MREQIEFLKQDQEREFNQAEFMKHRLFPWAKDTRTWVKIIRRDLDGENILRARIEGDGYTARYFIKSRNIIKYLNKYGLLMMGTIRPKQKYGNKREKRD